MNYNLPYQTVAERKVVYDEMLKHVDERFMGTLFMCYKLQRIMGRWDEPESMQLDRDVESAFPELYKIIKDKLNFHKTGSVIPHHARPEALKEAIAECERILSQTTSKS